MIAFIGTLHNSTTGRKAHQFGEFYCIPTLLRTAYQLRAKLMQKQCNVSRPSGIEWNKKFEFEPLSVDECLKKVTKIALQLTYPTL